MDSDDDICVLQGSPENSEANLQQPVFLFSPLSPQTLSDFQRGSIIGLQKGYAELKRRFRETNAKNAELIKKVQELESLRNSGICSTSSLVGESFDMMEDAGYNNVSHGGAATADQLGAEQGYSVKLQRELLHTKKQMDDMQQKYNEMVDSYAKKLQEMNNRISTLSQEKAWLQQSLDNVQIEKEKAVKEGASLHLSLQKVNQEVAILKDKQAEGASSEPSPEIVADLANMRKVIESLKKMVLAQRQYLEQRGMSMSCMSRSLRAVDNSTMQSDFPPLSTPGPSSSGSVGSSGASWEMVNGSVPSLNSRQQQQQQRSLTPAATSGVTKSPLSPKPSISGSVDLLKPLPGVPLPANIKPMGQAQNGIVVPRRTVSAGQKAKTDIIQRRRLSEDEVVQGHAKSKTEVIRSHTSPAVLSHSQSSGSGLGVWMENHYKPQPSVVKRPQAGAGGQPQLSQAENHLQQAGVGPNQFTQLRSGGGVGFDGQKSGSLNRAGQNWPNVGQQQYQSPYSPGSQQLPMGDMTSTYDNLTMGNTIVTSSNNAVPPSLHIFNQNAYAGARVVQSCSPDFGTRPTANVVITASHLPGLTTGIGRDSGMSRGSPQEHIDLTPAPNPTNFELNQFHPIHFENEITPQIISGQLPPSQDRKCPVCVQDFSHISMDEFQTHVFECFDDAEESNGPETLLPQVPPRAVPQGTPIEKICPMCAKSFQGTISQELFETHVQNHFEEGDPFEVLQPPRS